MLSFVHPIWTKNWRKTNLVASGDANLEQPKLFSSFSDTVRSGQSGASKSFNVPLAHPECGHERRDANVGLFSRFLVSITSDPLCRRIWFFDILLGVRGRFEHAIKLQNPWTSGLLFIRSKHCKSCTFPVPNFNLQRYLTLDLQLQTEKFFVSDPGQTRCRSQPNMPSPNLGFSFARNRFMWFKNRFPSSSADFWICLELCQNRFLRYQSKALSSKTSLFVPKAGFW